MKGKLGDNRNCNENNTKSNNTKINNALVSQIQDIEKHKCYKHLKLFIMSNLISMSIKNFTQIKLNSLADKNPQSIWLQNYKN